MLSLIVSTVAYFAASYYIKRYLDGLEAPPGFKRNALTFCAALLIAYGVAAAVDWAQSPAERPAVPAPNQPRPG